MLCFLPQGWGFDVMKKARFACDLMALRCHVYTPQAHFLSADEAAATKDSSWATRMRFAVFWANHNAGCVGLGG